MKVVLLLLALVSAASAWEYIAHVSEDAECQGGNRALIPVDDCFTVTVKTSKHSSWMWFVKTTLDKESNTVTMTGYTDNQDRHCMGRGKELVKDVPFDACTEVDWIMPGLKIKGLTFGPA